MKVQLVRVVVLGEYHFFTLWCRKGCTCFQLVAQYGAPENVRMYHAKKVCSGNMWMLVLCVCGSKCSLTVSFAFPPRWCGSFRSDQRWQRFNTLLVQSLKC